MDSKKEKVLMVGPDRMVRGGISSVVDSYYQQGLDKKIFLTYLPTMQDGSKLKKLILAMISYIRFCRMVSQYDIVHIHMAAQASFIRKAFFVKRAYKAGKKVIIHQHAADFDDFYLKQSNEKKRKKIKKIFSFAESVIVLSESWADFFGNYICSREKIVIIHNGVVIPEYQKSNYADHNILFLGRLGKRKGTYDLLKAIPHVLEAVPDAKFYLGGDGDVKGCQQIAKEKGFGESMHFLGWVRDEIKEDHLKKCSLFVLPSYHEGMPMSVLEAMSYGLATISTNAGGIPQIIENYVNGIRIEAGNIEALSETLIELLMNERKKEELGMAARKRIESDFDISANIDSLCRLYAQLMAGDLK